MSAGVHDRISVEIVRQVRVIRLSVKGELEHPCPGQLESITKFAYIGCNQAQILGDERQRTQFLFGRVEKICAWTGHPLAAPGRCCLSRYVPGRCKCSEVVEANQVHMRGPCP